MDYRQLSKDLLKRKKQLEAAVMSLELQKEQLTAAKFECKSPTYSPMPVSGGGYGDGQQRLAAILDKITDCEYRARVVERELKMITIGMSVLSEYQQDLLQGFFIDAHRGAADDLCEKHFKERSVLYDDRKKALDAFTIAVFGMLEN